MNSSFDGQAKDFDQRTGLPDAACPPIAEAVLQSVEEFGQSEINMIELGAGTGQIGQHFHRDRVRYTGLDNSIEMLEIFRSRKIEESNANKFKLVHADANHQWPVDSNSINLVLSSRAVHLFDTQHVCEELNRVASSAGLVFAVGRRKREKNSIPSVMRTQMRHLLSEHGIEGRNGQNHMMKLAELMKQITTVDELDSKTVSHWSTSRSPHESIQAWQKKDGLAGLQIEEKTKKSVLTKLENWAAEHFDDVMAKSVVNESYVLDLFRIMPKF